MNTIYAIVLLSYSLGILFLSPFNKKANRWIHGRKKWKSALREKIGSGENWIWFHCSSLGEFEDSCEIFFKIQQENPTKKTILTVFSPSAFEVLKNSGLFDVISYLPLDTKGNAEAFMEIVNPELVLFSRSELWLHFLQEVRAREIPLFLISLKLNASSNFIQWPFRIFYKRCFEPFTVIYCQNSETQELLHSNFGLQNTIDTGNTRFERVYQQSLQRPAFPEIEEFVSGSFVVVMGSSLPKEERHFLEIYDGLKAPNLKWIIVPHEIEKSIVAKKMNPEYVVRYSSIKEMNKSHDVLIIDSVGILKHIYRYADFAIIGGGFDRIGIHNIVEPAVHGVHVAFGPNHKHYDEAVKLLELGGAHIYRNREELKKLIERKRMHPENMVSGESIMQYVKGKAMSSSIITDSIRSFLHA